MADQFQIVPYQVRSAGTDVPPEEIQRGLNQLAQQVQLALNLLASGGSPPGGPAGGDLSGTYPNPTVTGLHVTSGSISGVTGVTGTRVDNTTALATNAFVNQQIASTTAAVPIPLSGGIYNQATLGTGTSFVIFVSGGVISSVISVIGGGTGYVNGDLLLVIGGNYDGLLRVTNAVAGVIQSGGLTVLYGGSGYTTGATTGAVSVPPGQRSVTFTGVLTSNVTFIIQNGTFLTASRRVQFNNNTTGAFTVTVKLSNGIGGTTGTGVVLPQGTNDSTAVIVQTDGMNDVWLSNTPAGIGAAATSGTLAQFAATTSAQLAGVISDETGTGSLVFGTNPTIAGATTTGGTINNTPVGATTPNTGSFTTLNSTGGALNGTLGATTPNPVAATTISATGTITPSQTNGIVGTTTNNNANAGSVGEYITATLASGSAIGLTNSTGTNVITISLTAGDWDVSGIVNYTINSATVVTQVLGGVSNVSLNFLAGLFAVTPVTPAGAAGYTALSAVAPEVRFSLAATTTVYLVANASFSTNTCSAWGTIRARRVR